MKPRPWSLPAIVIPALVGILSALTCCQQEATPERKQPERPKPRPDQPGRLLSESQRKPLPDSVITYPRDKDQVLARVNQRNITLEDIVTHIDSRHFEGFKDLVALPAGQLEIRTPRLTDWIRQYADMVALRTEARKRDISETLIARESGLAVTAAFEEYKADYQRQSGRSFPTTPEAVKPLRDRFLKIRGIGLEVEGLLNAMVPDELNQIGADNYLKWFTESVNGVLQVAHVFVRNRDPRTGQRYDANRMKSVHKKLAEIERRLKAGEEFGNVARDLSEDTITGPKGGLFDNLLRFDPRMPASFCRAAWKLRDRTWVGPVETKYGLHFIRRNKWTIRRTILRLMADNKDVRRMVRTHFKEDLLFQVRADHHVELVY